MRKLVLKIKITLKVSAVFYSKHNWHNRGIRNRPHEKKYVKLYG